MVHVHESREREAKHAKKNFLHSNLEASADVGIAFCEVLTNHILVLRLSDNCL